MENVTYLILQSLSGDAERGGWQATASFANNQAKAQYGRAVDVYSMSEGSSIWETNFHKALSGTVIPQNVIFDRKQSNTSVTISTYDYFLNSAGLQGIYFSKQASPAAGNPHQATYWNLGLIIKHIIEGHFTVTENGGTAYIDTSLVDILHSTSVDVYTVRQNNSIWSAIGNIAENEFYVRYFTREDKLVYTWHPQYSPSLPAPVFTLSNNNLVAQPEIIYRQDVATDQVQLYALTDAGVILQSQYPASVGTDGRKQKYSNLRCNSQARLDLLAQRAYKYLNRDYDFRVSVAGAWGCYCDLYDRVNINYTGTSRNGISVAWADKKFYIKSVNVNRVGNFGAVSEFYLEEENL